MEKAAVVIPNWNGEDMIADCLTALRKQSVKLMVIVVDNGSTDSSKEIISRDFPEVKLIELPRNTGFTGGVNPGMEYAMREKFPYVILLNNDAVVHEKWAEELIKAAAADKKVGIVAPKLMRMDKRHLDSTGEIYTVWGLSYPRGRNEVDKGQYDDLREIFGATGGASLYKTAMLEEIGIMDSDFFAYFEDVDISFRAHLAGWKVRYQPSAIAYHHLSVTSARMGNMARYHSAKNFMLTYAKNMPLKLYLKYLPFFILQLLRMAVTGLLRGKFLVFLKGSWAAIRLHLSTTRKRRQIQKSRTVSVDYIDSILARHRPPKPPTMEARL